MVQFDYIRAAVLIFNHVTGCDWVAHVETLPPVQ